MNLNEVAALGEPKCDFCSDPEPRWIYPARSFEGMPGAIYEAGWAACEACHRLIEKLDFEALAERSWSALRLEGRPEVEALLRVFKPETLARIRIRGLHRLFETNRLGPAEPWRPVERKKREISDWEKVAAHVAAHAVRLVNRRAWLSARWSEDDPALRALLEAELGSPQPGFCPDSGKADPGWWIWEPGF